MSEYLPFVIFQPMTLPGGLTVKNRLVVAPMTTYSSRPDGVVNDDELAFLHRRAKGGFGLVMTAACYVHPSGHAFDNQWACSDDRFIPSLKSMSDAIHDGGAASVLQIHHGGRSCPARILGHSPWSASAIPLPREGADTPIAMTEEQIELIIQSYAEAARRAKQAGYDAVEIHGANTYLLQQFVSPHSNRREDKWGLDRLLFSKEVTDRVFAAVGPNYPVGYRFSPEEVENPGITIDQTEALLKELLKRPLAWLHISLRDYRMSSLRGDFEGPTLNRIARLINKRVPFIGVGAVRTKEDAEATLAAGADMVALARSAVIDPEWPVKAMTGESPLTEIPAKDAQELLTLPKLMSEKIYTIPGWFPVEGVAV